MTKPNFPPPEVINAKASPPKGPGRPKGAEGRAGSVIKEAMLAVYRDLQAGAGGDNKHFLEWAKAHPSHFYRLCMRLVPQQVDANVDSTLVGAIIFKGLNG